MPPEWDLFNKGIGLHLHQRRMHFKRAFSFGTIKEQAFVFQIIYDMVITCLNISGHL